MNSSRLSVSLRPLLLASSRSSRTLTCSCSCFCRRPRRVSSRSRGFTSASPATSSSGLRGLLQVSGEVSEAIAANKPVVALESTIYTHGTMGKDLAREHVELVRSCGGVPAIIAILDGAPSVGVSSEDIVRMIEDPSTVKASRRDVSYLVGMGLTGRKIHGGTTIASTMLLARLAGIRVFGTGGLGGVHRGGQDSMDISADLTELGRTRVAVISSGCKGFLDIPRTLEYLETQGCLVSTFADGRSGNVEFPAFWARESGSRSPSVVYTEKEAAAMILAQEKLNIESGLLFANPIPEEFSIPAAEMKAAIELAVSEAAEKGFTGSTNTPYILAKLKEVMGDRVLVANKALVKANIERATRVAVELSRLILHGSEPVTRSFSQRSAGIQNSQAAPVDGKADILVAGSVAVDLSCDYTSKNLADIAPRPHTSNRASISQSIGGVGRNVALAAHLASSKVRVKFCSMVGDDVAGSTVLSSLQDSGLDTSCVRRIGQEHSSTGRTAQYVAINDANKNLVFAMADMGIFTSHPSPDYWKAAVASTKPNWVVVDANWDEKSMRTWLDAAKENGAKVAFEPVSTVKSAQLFPSIRDLGSLALYPQPSVHLSSPNAYELAAMYVAAREAGYLESPEWFEIIDSFGMRGARDRFIQLTSSELTDAGVPVQSVQLLPYIPTIVTKLGAKGVLLTELLGREDPRLRDRDSERFILARSMSGHPSVGGIYMRLYPPVETVESVVSVNGVGDSFLGVLMSGLVQGGRVEELIDVAQKGAVLSLKSHDSVSRSLSTLEDDLSRAISRT